MKSALIIGATGLIGSHVVRLALESYDKVMVLVRKESGQQNPKLEQRVIDFDQLATIELPQAEDVFCAIGTTIRKAGSQAAFRKIDLEYPRTLADRMAKQGARQFLLVSSVDANAKSGNFYLRTKGELEDEISKLGFPSLHVFRPSMLMGERPESRPMEKIGIGAARLLQGALVGSWRRYRPIAGETVAAAMIAAARIGKQGTHLYHYDQIRQLASGALS